MYASYLYPVYRGWGIGYPWGYPTWGFGGVPGNYYGGTAINAVGSAIANQRLINTGTMAGVTQTATPTVIW